MRKLTEVRKGKESMFQIVPEKGKWMRWDSSVFVHIPWEIWNAWYAKVVDNAKSEEPLAMYYRDVDECGGCMIIGVEHLSAIMTRWNETTHKEEIDLDY